MLCFSFNSLADLIMTELHLKIKKGKNLSTFFIFFFQNIMENGFLSCPELDGAGIISPWKTILISKTI